jgi:hypothetical protein
MLHRRYNRIRSKDILKLVATTNPYPDPARPAIARSGEDVRESPRDRASTSYLASRSLPRRAAIAAILALALIAPAYAMRNEIGELVDLGARGDSINAENTSLTTLTGLHRLGITRNIRRLATHDGYDFFVSEPATGQFCFAVAPQGLKPAVTTCGSEPWFPSRTHPVLDMSGFRASSDREAPIASHVVGFAADGVARVGVEAINGVHYWTDVTENTYALSPPAVGIRRLVAEAEDGSVLYEKRLSD